MHTGKSGARRIFAGNCPNMRRSDYMAHGGDIPILIVRVISVIIQNWKSLREKNAELDDFIEFLTGKLELKSHLPKKERGY